MAPHTGAASQSAASAQPQQQQQPSGNGPHVNGHDRVPSGAHRLDFGGDEGDIAEHGITMSFGPESPVHSDSGRGDSGLIEATVNASEANKAPAGADGNTPEVKGDNVANEASRQDDSDVAIRERSGTIQNKHLSAGPNPGVSEWSHQQHLQPAPVDDTKDDDGWQDMPAYAPYDIYDDDNKLVAREHVESDDEQAGYTAFGGGRGYTRVIVDEDAKSATSMDENTAYLFKETSNALDDDEEARNIVEQMQATKDLLTPNERIAYVGVVRLALAEMEQDLAAVERTRGSKKELNNADESMKMLTQKLMIRLYSHIELEPAEQLMIEQLTQHGLKASDLTPTLMRNSRVKNPMKEDPSSTDLPGQSKDEQPANELKDSRSSTGSPEPESAPQNFAEKKPSSATSDFEEDSDEPDMPPPPYSEKGDNLAPEVLDSADVPVTKNIDIDLRWTVLCDLFLILIADSIYDARSRVLLERVGAFLDVPWLEICRFEKRITDALEMQEIAQKEVWNEEEHIENRKKLARRRRLMYMGIATVGGGLIIGLSAGMLAPMIGAGLAAGFTTIGVSGTGAVLGSTGAAAVIGTGGTVVGSTIGVRAANRRTGHVKTFEYRPLHNNKRVNLVVTVAGWMNGKVDDVRLPFSTVDPIMGDIFSVLWEPEMLTSMGDTINILATEALTQGLQQILGSTILITLMSALQLPLVLSKLSYLIDNPWSVSMARADAAGLILADSLIDRNLGTRPITLVGFSLGSRVIVSALRELAKKHAVGLIQNVYLFGSPVVVKKDEYLRARSVVSGRFVNGYATNDWILGYLFRATGGGIMRVAGLASVDVPGIENFDVTNHVPGHMAYRKAMPKVLREVGWSVTSDEFSEIEDPDPENHQARQRQLINEIEEARKELEANSQKKRFGLFRRNKKGLTKKNWEMYDERSNRDADATDDTPNAVHDSHGGVIFDVDAIQREILELAKQGIEIKQLDSTLPPMKLNPTEAEEHGAVTPRPSPRMSKDYFSESPSRSHTSTPTPAGSSRPSVQTSKSYDHDSRSLGQGPPSPEPEPEDDNIQMTFDTAFDSPQKPKADYRSLEELPRTKDHDKRDSTTTEGSREPLSGAHQSPWNDDDDDEFREKEMEMTFA